MANDAIYLVPSTVLTLFGLWIGSSFLDLYLVLLYESIQILFFPLHPPFGDRHFIELLRGTHNCTIVLKTRAFLLVSAYFCGNPFAIGTIFTLAAIRGLLKRRVWRLLQHLVCPFRQRWAAFLLLSFFRILTSTSLHFVTRIAVNFLCKELKN